MKCNKYVYSAASENLSL